MEDFTILVLGLCFVAVLLAVILRDMFLRLGEIRADERLAKTGYYREIGRKGLESRWGKKDEEETEEPEQVGAWVEDLFSFAGIPVESLFQDEMPAELQAVYPAIKGMIDQMGGPKAALEKLKGNVGQTADDGRLYI
jgi:hypothetical protein